MELNSTKAISVLALIMLVLSLTPMLPAASASSTRIYLDPSTISYTSPPVTIGDKINVSVLVEDVTDLAAFEVKVYYDDCFLNVTRWFEPTWDNSYVFYGLGTMAVPSPPDFDYNHVDPCNGSAHAGVSMFPAPPPGEGFSGSGLLMIFEFIVTDVPGKLETLSCSLHIDNPDTYLLNSAGEEITPVTKEDGSYEISWSEPPKPWFATEPAQTVLNPEPYYENVTGKTFDVDVVIKNYYAAWGMTKAAFCLSYNSTLINATAVVINTNDWAGPNDVSTSHNEIDWVDVTVRGFKGPQDGGASVRVATITFEVLHQGVAPPRQVGDYDETSLAFCDETEIWNHEYTIHDPAVDSLVRIYVLVAIPLPHFEVYPAYTELGPEPAIGEEFEVAIKINEMKEVWHMVAYQLRLGYDDELLEALEIIEGPFLTDPLWNWYGTVMDGSLHEPPIDPWCPQWNVVLAAILLPNMTTGEWDQTVFPNTDDAADNTLATIRFRVIKQGPENMYCCNLTLYPLFDGENPEWLMDKGGEWIAVDDAQDIDGEYCITTSLPGRVIDVYTQYPAPYGGQGPNKPSDMFWPQKEVILYANVTYNYWPVQQKLVTFIVWDNEGDILTVLEDVTDENGVACVSFRLPWPCDNPEQYFGVWRVRADVDIAGEVVTDELTFHYDYLINIIEVGTDKYYYKHCEWVCINVTFTSHAQQMYDVAIRVTIHDELNVPIAHAVLDFQIGGAEYCTAKVYSKTFSLHIEKIAFAGYAIIHVVPRMHWNCAWCAAGPEKTAEIVIEPY